MTGIHAVLLPVGTDFYAVPMDWVKEVVVVPAPTRLVTAPPLVLGLFNLRGQIVPLLDTAILLGLRCAEPATFALVLQSRDGLISLAATAFPQRALLGSSIGSSELPGTAGTYRWQGQVAVLLDPDVLLASEQLGRSDIREGALPGGVRT
jgi:purine-binding chemotaxis protein CheW